MLFKEVYEGPDHELEIVRYLPLKESRLHYMRTYSTVFSDKTLYRYYRFRRYMLVKRHFKW